MRAFAVLAAVMLCGCDRGGTAPPAAGPPQNAGAESAKRYPLDEESFRAVVQGLTKDQVLAHLGMPERADERTTSAFVYRGPFRVKDGGTKATARISFSNPAATGGVPVVLSVEFAD